MDPRPRIIAGSARSGTTWVVDALTTANRAGTLFEPLNPDAVPDAHPLANQRIEAGAEDSRAKEFFDALFRGAYRNLWTLGRVYGHELTLGTDRSPWQVASKVRAALTNYLRFGRPRGGPWLYKVVRANLMLGWLERQYDARIALVIRHPGAVVASRVRRSWPWRPTLEHYLRDPQVEELLGDDQLPWAQQIEDEIRGHTAIWCIQHKVALHDWESSRYTVHFYEHLIKGRTTEWARMAQQLELPELPSAALLAKPSQQADQGSKGAMVGGSPRWRSALSRPEVSRLDETLERFACNLYEAGRDRPTDAAEHFLESR